MSASRILVRRRGGEVDEAEPLEDRPAVRGRVHLQVPEAARGGERGPVRDERPENPATPPLGQGAAAPDAGELGTAVEFHPTGGDRRVAGPGGHGRGPGGGAAAGGPGGPAPPRGGPPPP